MNYSICRSTALMLLLWPCFVLNAQPSGASRQQVNYLMKIDFNAAENKFSGYQKAIYTNSSSDTLKNIFYHLFYNAFQPGSAMEQRALNIRDQEAFSLKIQALKPDECGYQHIDSLKINGRKQPFIIVGTIMKVSPVESIAPHSEATIEVWFKSQVPKMIVRTGRNNSEKVAYTMTQWYPKIAAYDRAGWHTEEYVRREFYGPFANFDVSINIDRNYCVAGTGILQNPEETGYGYGANTSVQKQSSKKSLMWHFKAERVHDFAWAADSTYHHSQKKMINGVQLHLFYKPTTATIEDWQVLPEQVEDIFKWMENKVGPYPYPQYSLVQGGSGGTEYPMLTMILGKRPTSKGMAQGYPIITLAIHEIMHNWWYSVVANDESRNAWLDEGFALFFQYEYTDYMAKGTNNKKSIDASYEYMLPPAKIGALEPMSTPADFYDANWAYDIGAYHMGAVFLNQLRYIVGEKLFWKGIRQYYATWAFSHPDGDDFIHIMEQASGIQLKWYLDLWTKTSKHIDYAVGKVERNEGKTAINLLMKGQMPMPVDILLELKDGTEINYTIPQVSMYGAKNEKQFHIAKAWSWTNPKYQLMVPYEYSSIKRITIDPDKCLFDLHRENNSISIP